MSRIAVRQLEPNSKLMNVEIQQVAYLLSEAEGQPYERRDVTDALFNVNTTIFGAYFTDTPSAENGLPLVGTASLVKIVTPKGVHYDIHNVAVYGPARGQGIAEMMILEALAEAKARGGRYIDLTSRPERKAANCLYQKLGFQHRATNNYRLALHA